MDKKAFKERLRQKEEFRRKKEAIKQIDVKKIKMIVFNRKVVPIPEEDRSMFYQADFLDAEELADLRRTSEERYLRAKYAPRRSLQEYRANIIKRSQQQIPYFRPIKGNPFLCKHTWQRSGPKEPFTQDELDEYEILTYLTSYEIKAGFELFRSFDPELIDCDKNARIATEKILVYPYFAANPWGDRIIKIFSSEKSRKKTGLTFDDFVNLMSCFKKGSGFRIKSEYAFRLLDLDGDGCLDIFDLEKVVMIMLCNEPYRQFDVYEILYEVIYEADMDDDLEIEFDEFCNALKKAYFFKRNFSIPFYVEDSFRNWVCMCLP